MLVCPLGHRALPENVPVFFYAAFTNILAIAKENFMLQFRDSANNAAQSYCENDVLRKLPIYVGNVFELFFDYFKMGLEFLLKNTEGIIRMISESDKNNMTKTLDIDFTGYIQTSNLLEVTTDKLCGFNEVFENAPFKRIPRLVLRFSCVNLACDLRLDQIEKVDFYCDSVTFSEGFVLPTNLNKIEITNSVIEIDFILPETTRVLNLKGSSLSYNAKLQISSYYSNINIKNTNGDIRIPSLSKYFVFFKKYSQLVINKNQKGDVEELFVEEAIFKPNWHLRKFFKEIHLKNIKSEGRGMTIDAVCEVLDLQLVNYILNLGSMAQIENTSSDIIPDYDSFRLEKDDDIWKLEMMNSSTKRSRAIKQQIEGISFTPIQITIDDSKMLHLNGLSFHLIGFSGYLSFSGIRATGDDSDNHNTGEFLLNKYEESETFLLKMCNVDITRDFILPKNIVALHLENVRGISRFSMLMNEICEEIDLINYFGIFSISKFLFGENNLIFSNGLETRLRITKSTTDELICHLYNLNIETEIKFSDKITSLYFEEVYTLDEITIELPKTCKNILLRNSQVLIFWNAVSRFNTIWLDGIFQQRLELIQAPTKELYLKKLYLKDSATINSHVRTLILNRCSMLNGNVLTINKECERIYIRNFDGSLIVSNWERWNRDTQINPKGFYLFKYRPDSGSVFILRKCVLNDDVQIREEITEVALYNVSFPQNNNPIILNSSGLRRIALIRCMFLYDPEIHFQLKYLYLESVDVDQVVVFNENIETIEMKNVYLEKRAKFIFHEGLQKIKINSSKGEINFSGIGGFKTILIGLHQAFNYTKKGSKAILEISQFKFYVSHQLSNDIQLLSLKNVELIENTCLFLNECCEKIEIKNCKGVIDVSKARSINSVIFHDSIPKFESSTWICIRNRSRDRGNFSDVINIPRNIKSIKLKTIKFSKSTKVRINKECEELSLSECSATFDLSGISNLKKLEYAPNKRENIIIEVGELDTVEELSLAYNTSTKYFQILLQKCVNVKTLKLFGSIFLAKKLFKGAQLHYCKVSELNAQKREVGNYIDHSRGSNFNEGHFNQFNTCLNIAIKPIFTLQRRSTLERLNLSDVGLLDNNLKLLKEFYFLRELSISYESINGEIFDNLPENLEMLQIKKDKIFKLESRFPRGMELETNAKALKTPKQVRMLFIEGSFFLKAVNFLNLPANLECLKLTYFDTSLIDLKRNMEKIKLRKVIIIFQGNNIECDYYSSDEIGKKVLVHELINYLKVFIDFESLEELIVEDSDKTINFDPTEFNSD